jgi:hypothetical protein
MPELAHYIRRFNVRMLVMLPFNRRHFENDFGHGNNMVMAIISEEKTFIFGI